MTREKKALSAALVAIACLTLCLLVPVVQAAGAPWYKVLSEDLPEGHAIHVDGTNVYTIAGAPHNDYDSVTIARWDSEGNVVWRNSTSVSPDSYESSYDSDFPSVYFPYSITTDSDHIFTTGGSNLLVWNKTQGNLLWNKTATDGTRDLFWSDMVTSPTTIFVVGTLVPKYNSVGVDPGMIVALYNFTGTQVANTTIHSTLPYIALSMCKVGTLLFTAGMIRDPLTYESKQFIACWDDDGSYNWNVSYGTSGHSRISSIASDGTWLYACGQLNGAPVAMRLHLNGTIDWTLSLPGWEANAIYVVGSAVYVAGSVDSQAMFSTASKVAVTKVSSTGVQAWTTSWGPMGGIAENMAGCNLYGKAIAGTATEVYVLGKGRAFRGIGVSDPIDTVLLKFDASGNGPSEPIQLGLWLYVAIFAAGGVVVVVIIAAAVKKRKAGK